MMDFIFIAVKWRVVLLLLLLFAQKIIVIWVPAGNTYEPSVTKHSTNQPFTNLWTYVNAIISALWAWCFLGPAGWKCSSPRGKVTGYLNLKFIFLVSYFLFVLVSLYVVGFFVYSVLDHLISPILLFECLKVSKKQLCNDSWVSVCLAISKFHHVSHHWQKSRQSWNNVHLLDAKYFESAMLHPTLHFMISEIQTFSCHE